MFAQQIEQRRARIEFQRIIAAVDFQVNINHALLIVCRRNICRLCSGKTDQVRKLRFPGG